jgi:hypothetical protein
MLGHLEVAFGLDRWAAPPCCLIGLEEPAGRLLMTGAITSNRPDQIDSALASKGVDAAVLGPFDEGGRGPSSWHVEARPDTWDDVQAATGLQVVRSAARGIAAALPPCDLAVIATAHLPDDRFPAAPIDPDTLLPAWGRPVMVGAPAIQLLQGGRPVWWILHADGSASRLPSGEWAVWLAARDQPQAPIVLDPDGTLRVDAAAPLPPLHARAACLCSGRLPARAHSAPGVAEDRHRAVPPSVGEAILASLMHGRAPASA